MRDYVRRLLAPVRRRERRQRRRSIAGDPRKKAGPAAVRRHDAGARRIWTAARNQGRPGLSSLPVILLSARAGDDAKVEGLNAGADDYLTKPFSAQELLARVNANITMARLRREIAAEVEVQKTRLQAVLDTVPVAVWFTFDSTGLKSSATGAPPKCCGCRKQRTLRFPCRTAQAPQHFRVFKDGGGASADACRCGARYAAKQ